MGAPSGSRRTRASRSASSGATAGCSPRETVQARPIPYPVTRATSAWSSPRQTVAAPGPSLSGSPRLIKPSGSAARLRLLLCRLDVRLAHSALTDFDVRPADPFVVDPDVGLRFRCWRRLLALVVHGTSMTQLTCGGQARQHGADPARRVALPWVDRAMGKTDQEGVMPTYMDVYEGMAVTPQQLAQAPQKKVETHKGKGGGDVRFWLRP